MNHSHQAQRPESGQHMQHGHSPYRRLLLMAVLSFLAMYGLMYAMVDTAGDVFSNVNQAYMAALMSAPMIVIEIALMGMMYPDKKANAAILLVGVALLAGSWFAIRYQAGIGDGQFLRSMIPHHSGAILMCRRASLQDPEIKTLCGAIEKSQREEIVQMKRLLENGQ